jgi:hypothetical protein
MIARPSLTRAEKAAAQQAARVKKTPRDGRTLIFEKGRGTSVQTVFKRKSGDA